MFAQPRFYVSQPLVSRQSRDAGPILLGRFWKCYRFGSSKALDVLAFETREPASPNIRLGL